jgi:hypothetical protein
MLGYDSVQAAMDSWEMQTCRDRIEILVLCPDHMGPTPQQEAELPPDRIIVLIGRADLHEARALGLKHASGEYIMLAEDHCLPDPNWAEAMLDRLQEGWDAVGPALRPGNRSSAWAEGSFLIGYGEWMTPIEGGPAKVLCGWNGVVRTRLLRELGQALAGDLLLGAFLMRRLRQQGHRFYLEARAGMRHFDPPGWAYEIFLLTLVGLGFGAMRTRGWSPVARFSYPLAAPAIAFLHWKRALTQYRRAGTAAGLRSTALIAAVGLASAWGFGEAAGAWLGVRRVARHLWRTEVKPVSRGDVDRSCEQEHRQYAR